MGDVHKFSRKRKPFFGRQLCLPVKVPRGTADVRIKTLNAQQRRRPWQMKVRLVQTQLRRRLSND